MAKPRKITDWTVAEFRRLPQLAAPCTFTSLVLLPTRRKHSSGYRAMAFVAVDHGKPLGKLSGWSDVLHLGGISGQTANWAIDCLPKSGLLHLFAAGYTLKTGLDVSSFEIFAREK
jgi:hypothetical protein